jgi:hypothetical protein
MKRMTGPEVIGAELPQAGPSEVLMIVPLRLWASSENTDVPGAEIPVLAVHRGLAVQTGGPPTVLQRGVPNGPLAVAPRIPTVATDRRILVHSTRTFCGQVG